MPRTSPLDKESSLGMSENKTTLSRIESLDQFRGYTVAGMFLVNYVGGYEVVHSLLKHHNTHCSYADTIMPQFLFAVGFAFRLTFGRRMQEQGSWSAYFHVFRRLLGLILIGLVIYTADHAVGSWEKLKTEGLWEAIRVPLKREWFQTLVHIAVTSAFVLPVISASKGVRVAFMLFFAGVHVLLSHLFYLKFGNTKPVIIDGGPLGFLTWQIPLLVGSLACDWMKEFQGSRTVWRMVFWSVVLMAFGYGLSCISSLYDVREVNSQKIPVAWKQNRDIADSPVLPSLEGLEGRSARDFVIEPPFVPPPAPSERKHNYWMMSQRNGSVSYLFFGAGVSLAVYVLFVLFCDCLPLRFWMFRTFGTNALAGYIIHGMVMSAVQPFFPGNSPWPYMWTGFAIYFGITYLFVRHLEKNNIFLKM